MRTAARQWLNAATGSLLKRGRSLINVTQSDDEAARLAALYICKILGTPPEQEFDDITCLAANICGTPIALITLVDANRQWFKSKVGWEATETPHNVAFCTQTVLQSDILIVSDALNDKRFANNPLVTSEPYIRFYAGVSLITAEGQTLGTLCVIDRVPRELNSQQVEALQILARQVTEKIELRCNLADLEPANINCQGIQKQQKLFFRKIAAGFGLATAILTLITAISYQGNTGFINTYQQVAHSQEVLEELEDLISQVKDAETGQRGYLLTGKERYLEPYHSALQEIERELKVLRELTTDNSKQQQHLDTIKPLINQKIGELNKTINLRRDWGLNLRGRSSKRSMRWRTRKKLC